jgi:hypothetical protein
VAAKTLEVANAFTDKAKQSAILNDNNASDDAKSKARTALDADNATINADAKQIEGLRDQVEQIRGKPVGPDLFAKILDTIKQTQADNKDDGTGKTGKDGQPPQQDNPDQLKQAGKDLTQVVPQVLQLMQQELTGGETDNKPKLDTKANTD